MPSPNNMNRRRWFLLLVSLVLIVLSWWGIAAARNGLIVRSLEREGVPLLYMAPQEAQKAPAVLVAHGYAGSKQLMLGYAHVLAHSGYAVMLWDFGGHAANPASLERGSLQRDLDIATAALVEQPEVDPARLALLGHSMGSGAVMSAGIANVNRFAATIAVSPTGANVTPAAPRNLQLQAGSGEGRFVENAQRMLRDAGGENPNFAQGRARSLQIIPNVEHITILFSNASHQAAKTWLNATFNLQNTGNYTDRRMIWYALHLGAWLLLLSAISPRLADPTIAARAKVRPLQSWGGLLLAPVAAIGVLTLASRTDSIENLGGLLVGGAVALWFLVGGVVWLVLLGRLPRPTLRNALLGVALFALLWVAFGAMAQVVWLQWWLIPARLKLWPVLSLACLPWFLAAGLSQQDSGVGKRILWWLGQSVALVGGFFLTVYLVPQLGFMFLLLPVFPIIIAILSLAAAQVNEAWSYGIGSALYFGWILAAGFPLAG
ncbi:alpha/beta fold hydrolase [Microcoleus sp. FACHB-672]|uniref:alpha/beta fold hydrolase n=1 Tax=Microcoleus sp. FACHB-672 TaxID=2692825 RepID=UPI0018F03D05|nr:alpha/beta fold hydrolase [Microcoleus sp. FACHB-672]